MTLIKILTLHAALVLGATASAGGPPKFYANTYPEHALEAVLKADGILMGADATLNATTRELIALGVAAQIQCIYCIYVHTKKARAMGASEAEVREAVATAAHVRHGARYSTAWPTTSNPSKRKSTNSRLEMKQSTQLPGDRYA